MSKLRWKTSDLLFVTLLIAVATAAYRAYWDTNVWTGWFLFSAYLAALSTASLASYFASLPWRKLWLGYASFGWLYLVCVLYGGFGIERASEVQFLGERSVMGIVFGVMCAIAAHLLVPLTDEEK